MANKNNGPMTFMKPKLSFEMASTPTGLVNAGILRIEYEHEQFQIGERRKQRLADRLATPRTVKVRCGYPKRRVTDDDIPSNRGVPMSHFTRCFKRMGDKIMVLHATRGWKVYA